MFTTSLLKKPKNITCALGTIRNAIVSNRAMM